MPKFILLCVDIQLSQRYLFKRLLFPPLNGLDTLTASQWSVNIMVGLWTLSSRASVCVSVFMPVIHWLGHHSFALSSETEKCESSVVFFSRLFSLLLAYPKIPYISLWILGSACKFLVSITTNKASGGDGIPAELFQILEDDAVKVLHSIHQQIWKTQQQPQDWKGLFTPVPKKDNANECSNYCTIHSPHILVK